MYIVLIGFMGTGKSAVGRALARRVSGRVIDMDHEIERRFGKSVPRIFAEEGEQVFREAETRVLKDLMTDEGSEVRKAGKTITIISTGGGTPLRQENAALLKKLGSVVLLDASAQVILQRVSHNLANRPLLAGTDQPLGRIRELLAERRPRYIAAASHIIDTSHSAKPDDVAKRIVKALQLTQYSKDSGMV